MVVKALLSRLDLSGDHFDKEQRNTIAVTAKEVLVSLHYANCERDLLKPIPSGRV